MSYFIRRCVLVMFTLAIPVAVLADGQLKKRYTDEELVEILRNDGYRAVDISEDRVMTIKVDGTTFVLYVYDDDDLQLYFGTTGYALTPGNMNEWNRTRRLSRAYLDAENDPVLESDLLANAGYSEAQFLEWFKVFNYIALEFRQFLIENDQAN